MPTTISKLDNLITGNDADFQAAAKRTQDTLIALEALSNQVTASISGAFTGLVPTFNNIQSQVSQAGAAIQTSGGAAASAFAPVASVASQAAVSIANVSNAATQSAQSMTVLSSASVVASQGVADLLAKKTALSAQIKAVEAAMRSENSVIVDAQAKITQLGGGHQIFNQVIADSEKKIAAYAAEQLVLKTQLGQVNDSLKGVTVTQNAAGQTVADLGQKTSILAAIMQGHTSQITSQGTIWKGYDNVIQAVVRSMGGIPIVGALGITILGVLAEKLIHSRDAASSLKGATDELINSDSALISAFSALSGSIGESNMSLELQGQRYRSLLSQDITTTILGYGAAYAKLGETTAGLMEHQNRLLDLQGKLNTIQGLSTDTTEQQTLASQKYGTSLDALKSSISAENEKIGEGITARDKQNQAIQKFVDNLILSIRVTNEDIEAHLRQAKAVGITGDALNELGARLYAATNAQEQLNAAVRNFKPPNFDSSIATVDRLRDSINKSAAEFMAAGRSQGEILSVLRPSLEAYKKAVAEKTAAELTNAGTVVKGAQAQQILKDQLKGGIDFTALLAGKIQDYDKNLSALTSNTTKHASATRSSRSALDEFKTGVEGLDKAVAVVSAHLGDQSLFGRLGKDAAQQAQNVKAASAQVASSLNELFSAMGVKLKATAEEVLGLSKDTAAPLFKMETSFAALKKAIDDVNFKRVTEGAKEVEAALDAAIGPSDRLGSGLGVLDTSLTIVGRTIEISSNTFRALVQIVPNVVEQVEKAGFKFKEVFPAIGNALVNVDNRLEGNVQTVDRWASAFIDRLKQTASQAEKESKRLFPAEVINEQLRLIEQQIESSWTLAAARFEVGKEQIVESMAQLFTQLGQQMGKTGDELQQFVEDKLRVELTKMGSITEDSVNKQIEIWKRMQIQLPGIWEQVFGKMSASTQKGVQNILNVIGTMPGKIGDTLRSSQHSFEQWLSFIDSILKTLQGLFGKAQTGIAGAINDIIGIFKKKKPDIEAALDDILGPSDKSGKAALGLGNAIGGKVIEGVMGALAGVSMVAGTIGSGVGRVQGGLMGAIGGFLAGAKIGGMFGPAGILPGAIIGGVGGLIAGIFGGGKTALQKAQEAAQLQQAKDAIKLSMQQVQKGAQEVVQSAIKTFEDARAFLEKLADYTSVPKKAINSFFKNLNQLMDEFVKLSGKWSTDSIAKAKALAEGMAPVMSTIGAAVDSLSKLETFIPVADSIIIEFFHNLGDVITHFGQLAEEVPNTLERHAKRFARRMDPVVGVLSPFIDGIAKLFDFKPVTEESLDLFAQGLKQLVTKMGQIADELDLSMMKQAQRFAEKTESIATLLKDGVDGLVALKDLQPVTATAFDAFFAGIKTAVQKMTELASTLSTDMLGRAEMVSQKAVAIFSAIKAGVEAFTALRDYQAIPQEAISNLLSDFQRALDLLGQLLDGATKFESMALQLKDKITSGAAALTSAVTTFGQSVRDASFGLQSLIWGEGTGVVRPGFGDQSLLLSPQSQRASSSTVMNFHFDGMTISPSPDSAKGQEGLALAQAWARFFNQDLGRIAAAGLGYRKIL